MAGCGAIAFLWVLVGCSWVSAGLRCDAPAFLLGFAVVAAGGLWLGFCAGSLKCECVSACAPGGQSASLCVTLRHVEDSLRQSASLCATSRTVCDSLRFWCVSLHGSVDVGVDPCSASAAIAQFVKHPLSKREVVGSNPNCC